MIKNGAAHWPTNKAQLFLPETLRIAEAIIDPTAKPKYTLDGAPDVMDSMAPVKRSSDACPSPTLVCIFKSPALVYFSSAVLGCHRKHFQKTIREKFASTPSIQNCWRQTEGNSTSNRDFHAIM
jgi:hypothetical protein